MNDAYLLLGSNLGRRESYIRDAICLIEEKAGEVVCASSLYETEPWGAENSPAYINKVILLKTELSPLDLLSMISQIESELGRTRGEVKNEPRTIDIDILFYNKEIVDQPGLIIPHERLHLRKFVLVPLAEIAPFFVHPVFKKNVTGLLEECQDPLWVKRA